ncbi:uncharacterized protein LOC109536289 [Dendroctonus ponderosae]|uniref:RFX-type winged-helix domain-containing protein n=1 Tax=Dendroctonus ponderosae TaxID=77166 RepID=A0AAR5PA99_DENPD|nr:uncharacterized protein LOC109536289 [Dendroctonus ponderosae]XP_048523647.1 uncharacterized protein LOC109536289 [Dendroctonus ponderosae]KAH1007247.1 hypothetical protein HUJ04_004504 [Dendroctonus ponderosae]KAH1014719.1 hypothetical protein HUJ05_012560 [Dendroctonus ponderosae]
MDREQWSPDYPQSARRADMESTSSTGDAESQTAALQPDQIKEDPDGKPPFVHVKSEFGPGSVAISDKPRQTIQLILANIKTLSQNDKYLLYLKLPSEISDIIDPFRQPLNPLGSRSEICRTIVWIRTHLEEDQNISLPKKEVYNEYEQYCDKNHIKPLSQADFGKVMKQVFPKVRARRLGQRGNSKYCYSGLRRRISLEPPSLPDIVDNPLSTENSITQSSVSAAWLVIKDWAQQQLGVQFTSLQSLAHYLSRNCFVGSEAPSKVSANGDSHSKGEEPVGGKGVNKHREMQLQLQKKIQQRNEGKERKRKLQTPKPESKPVAKKCRSHSVPASAIASALTQESALLGTGCLTSGECSTASSSCGSNSVSPTQQSRIICDQPEFTQLTALPDFKSFQKPVTEGVAGAVVPDKVAPTGTKVAIPRLQPQTPSKAAGQVKATPPHKAKYKSIQPRLQPCDIATYNAAAVPVALAEPRSQLVQNEQDKPVNDKIMDKCADNLNECGGDDEDDFPLTRERLDSVSNVEKDAMDEYLGTNNSQHEEELSKYFHTNGDSAEIPAPDLDQTSKLSTLRQLLEQNGISEKRALASILPEPAPPFPSLPPFLQTLPSSRRRVSFETPLAEDAVPPSPSAQNKNFSFTPISPGPHSPTQSKCSSTSASPFVSPRNTPLPRAKNNAVASILLASDSRKRVKVKKELELSLDMKTDGAVKSYMAMSAPVSPMLASGKCNLLQKLLNASSKVQYTPEYAQPGPGEDAQFFPPDALNRSQSVPLSQMQAALDGQMISSLPESAVNVKSLLNTLGNEGQLCDNNNIDTFNLDMSSNNQCLMEYGLNLINTCGESEFSQFGHKLGARNITRSHSMDVDSSGGFDVNKCRSTQMPFTPTLKAPANRTANKNFLANSRSYPSTPLNSTETFIFHHQVSSDCLINGSESTTETLDFIPTFEIDSSDTGVGQMDGSFGLMDDNGILIQQGFNGNIN